MFHRLSPRERMTSQSRESFDALTGKCLHTKCFLNLKFCEWEPCALGKIIMAEVSWHIQSRTSTSRICRIIMPGCRNVKIAITAMPIATKFGRVATYYERLIPIKLDYPLIKWQTKIIYPQYLRPTKRLLLLGLPPRRAATHKVTWLLVLQVTWSC